MRPLSAFNASASALGNMHANWIVRSMGPASFPTVSPDGFLMWHPKPENGLKPGTSNPPDHLGWKPQWLAADYGSVSMVPLPSSREFVPGSTARHSSCAWTLA